MSAHHPMYAAKAEGSSLSSSINKPPAIYQAINQWPLEENHPRTYFSLRTAGNLSTPDNNQTQSNQTESNRTKPNDTELSQGLLNKSSQAHRNRAESITWNVTFCCPKNTQRALQLGCEKGRKCARLTSWVANPFLNDSPTFEETRLQGQETDLEAQRIKESKEPTHSMLVPCCST